MAICSLIMLACLGLPPVTQAEAVEFHAGGRCAMAAPGTGITRSDGRGWINSMLPGPHRIIAAQGTIRLLDGQPATSLTIDFPRIGYPVAIAITPGTKLSWCPEAKVSGRNECGPVPTAFLYNASLATDK